MAIFAKQSWDFAACRLVLCPCNTTETAAAAVKPPAVIKATLRGVAKHQANAGLLRGSRRRGYFDIFFFFDFFVAITYFLLD
jgi:hypothetical protein